jgi:hypothetical protein
VVRNDRQFVGVVHCVSVHAFSIPAWQAPGWRIVVLALVAGGLIQLMPDCYFAMVIGVTLVSGA